MGLFDMTMTKREVEFLEGSKKIEKVLSEDCSSYELLGKKSNEEASWFFAIGDKGGAGFIELEATGYGNEEPTVTISLKVGAANQFSRDDLFEILSANGALWRATYTVSQVEDDLELLMIQYKMLLSSFEEDDFLGIIDHLINQYQATLGSASEP